MKSLKSKIIVVGLNANSQKHLIASDIKDKMFWDLNLMTNAKIQKFSYAIYSIVQHRSYGINN
jgi:hypothetical protein